MSDPAQSPSSADHPRYSIELITELTGLTEQEVLLCYRAGWVRAESASDALLQFDDAALYNLRRLAHIRTTYGTTLAAAGLICQLLDEIDRLRAELEFWRSR